MKSRHEARAGSPDADAVLEAARRLLHAEGAGALTVRRIAAELGVSRQVVYSRFGNKAGLLQALYADGFSHLAQTVRDVQAKPGTDEHILAVAAAYRTRALAEPAIYGLLFDDTPDFEPNGDARNTSIEAFGSIVDVAARWLQVPPTDPKAVSLATSFWSASHGVVALERAGHLSPAVATRQLETIVRRILNGSRRIPDD
ncbi:MAG: TetR/AcrR family transcriptional regulator [Myxococcota bacterium]